MSASYTLGKLFFVSALNVDRDGFDKTFFFVFGAVFVEFKNAKINALRDVLRGSLVGNFGARHNGEIFNAFGAQKTRGDSGKLRDFRFRVIFRRADSDEQQTICF